MKKMTILFFRLLKTLLGVKRLESGLVLGLKTIGADLYTHALIQKGFSGWSNYDQTGEKAMLIRLKKSMPVNMIFDVGANDGTYSHMLTELFHGSRIVAFEPVMDIFQTASENLKENIGITLENIALSNRTGTLPLFLDKTNNNRQVSSTFRDGLADFYNIHNAEEIIVNVSTVDIYCTNHAIEQIDFIKIDVEGAELDVLKGCTEMLKKNAILAIQFEFNDFNIISRTFIKDFYDILNGFNFYRISRRELVPLGKYSSRNEIFSYQNILALHTSVLLQ